MSLEVVKHDDSVWAGKILSGDEKARDEFGEKLRPRLIKAAAYFLGPQDAELEDTVQEAFLIAYSKLSEYDGAKGGLYNWMNHILVYICFRRIKRRWRWAQNTQEDMEGLLAAPAKLRQVKADEEQVKQERLAVLWSEVEGMGEPCRETLRLRDHQGLSYADLSQKFKIPQGTIMSRLARCRESLKELLVKNPLFAS